MLTGLPALEATDWSKLHHAYGRATDTPAHLRGLLSHDSGERKKALEHLGSAIIHQGTPWTATGPAALVVAGILFDERVEQATDPARAHLIHFLASVAEAVEDAGLSSETLKNWASYDIDALLESDDDEAVYENEAAANSFFARAILGCVAALPTIMKVMLAGLNDPDHRVRMCAAMGAATVFKHPALASEAPDLPAQLYARAATAENTDECCTYVLALGDLGADPAQFLEDSSPAVRMCAAIAPRLEMNERAAQELLDLLENHATDLDNLFADRPPQFSMHPRFYVVSRLLKMVNDFDRLAPAAVAVLSMSSESCVDHDWGPLLAAAFPDGSGIVKTEAQRRFLTALTKRHELWNPRFGNPLKWFKKASLTYDRQDCINRAKDD